MNVPKKPLASVGQLISAEEFQSLKTGFATTFPTEAGAVFLSKQIILDCIASYPGLSGISFRYGLTDVNDPQSRKILLVPCEHTSDAAGIPEHLLFRAGYISNDGELVSLEQCWTLFGNHVERAYNGKHHSVLGRIHRGYFWGIDRIRELLNHDQCGGLIFHFGYNTTHPLPGRRHQQVLEVADKDGQGLQVYMEYGQCHPPCDLEPRPPGGGVGTTGICIVQELAGRFGEEEQLNKLRAFRDDYMLEQAGGYAYHEMYYYLSVPVVKAIQARPDHAQIWHDLYHNELQAVLALIDEQKMEEVLHLYRSIMQNLLHTYVLAGSEEAVIR
jgi:hypothetical protein